MEVYEEQAIESALYKPKIWKRYVDDTFTILDRSNVDSFLHHLNRQQPTINPPSTSSINPPWKPRKRARSTFLTRQLLENRTATLPPAFTGNQLTLISTWRMIRTTLNQ